MLHITKKAIWGQKSPKKNLDFLIWGGGCLGRLGEEECPCQNIHRENWEITEQFTLEFPMLGIGREESRLRKQGTWKLLGPPRLGLPGAACV